MLKSTGYFTNLKTCALQAGAFALLLGTLFTTSVSALQAKGTNLPVEKALLSGNPKGKPGPDKEVPPVPEENKEKQDSTAILLKEITVSAGVQNVKNSPLRLNNIDGQQIEYLAPGRTYPELMKNIPGVFATSESGNYGDAKINIRGFKQENISVLLNGTPISGLTSGSMFWNNWIGLTDATATIQVQKGIGGSMLSDNSVGGTINIITKSPGSRPSFNLGYSYTDGGTSKSYINYNSGELKRSWAISLLASYTWGHGWVRNTDINSWAYMLSVSKKINTRHTLLFTALGSPEEHEQRSTRLSYSEMEQYGRDYNKNWGFYTRPDGSQEARTINKNNYFKPYFTLNHFYNGKTGRHGNRNISINNAVYLAIGNGGGYWTESKGKRIIDYQKEGQIDWNAVVEANRTEDPGNDPEKGSARNIMSDYMAGHTQAGAKSTILLDLTDHLNLDAGLHYQYYRTWEKERITDLLGGKYWYEDYASKSLAGEAGRNPIKQVGDYIRTHNGKVLHYGTLYGMLTYNPGKMILKFGGSLNTSFHRRWDKYNYTAGNIYSKTARGIGGAVKAGLLYKLSNAHSLYLNAAFYSRTPYTSVYFASGNNQISEGVKNEKNILGEFGYRFLHSKGGVEATFYTAYWKNKSLMSNPYKPLEEDSYKYMISGLDAFHYGIEIDAWHNFTRWLKLSGYASIGSWRWKNNVNAKIYDPYSGQVAQEINVYSNGLPVGDAPQTQIGANLAINPLRNLFIRAEWQYNGRYWSDFEPSARTNPDDLTNPYRIPAYHLLNAGVTWDTVLWNKINIGLFFNLNNILDTYYIERGKDGKDHSAQTFTGYWGQGRNCNFGIRIGL